MTQNKILSIHKSLGRYSLCIVLRLYKFCKENICFEVGVFFPKRMLSQLRRRQPDNCFKKSICICYQHCDKKMFVSWLTAVIHWRIFWRLALNILTFFIDISCHSERPNPFLDGLSYNNIQIFFQKSFHIELFIIISSV